jgi:opacity protein-like surface antigen
MKFAAKTLFIVTILAIAGFGTASAQFGFGVGIASSGANLNQAAGNLSDLLSKDTISYSDVSGGFGFYLSGRMKYPLGPVRLVGDASFIYFPAKQITLTMANMTGSDASAEFNVGGTYIPIGLGLDYALPTPVLHPYIGAELTYTYVNRTFAAVSGNTDMFKPTLENRNTGSDWGLMVGAGIELNVFSVMALDVGARYNLENLFSKETDVPDAKYLQVGASLFYGDLYSSGSKE